MAEKSCRQAKKNIELQRILSREHERNLVKQVRKALKKAKWDRTEEESKLLDDHSNIVWQVQVGIDKRRCISERTKEITDPHDVFLEKCVQLAEALKTATSTVVYTGAGISTAAHIPDYRGPNGVWTLLQKGEEVRVQDLSTAEPTFTHMAIKQLYKVQHISHIVSQNCDGLHMRSGLPSKALSEVHGNMFIEVCPTCKPLKQYIRLFDVTENTCLHRHNTGRFCAKCGAELKDTIVHFGEKGTLTWPLNWKGASKAVSKADTILCLGTSLKVLKRYKCLWATDRPQSKRPKLFIINLQWTPKDLHCTLKIHGKCDEVMEHVMSLLDIEVPKYQKNKDPIFQIATPLSLEEKASLTRLEIIPSRDLPPAECERKIRLSTRQKKAAMDDAHCHSKTETTPLSQDAVTNCDDHVVNYELVSPKENKCARLDVTEMNACLEESKNIFPKLEELTTTNNEQCAMTTNFEKPFPDVKKPQISGWYGKGYAKGRKPKKRKLC